MNIYSQDIHKSDTIDVDITSCPDIDMVIEALLETKEFILKRHPEAFQIEVDINDSDISVSYFRNKTKSELDDYKKYQEKIRKELYKKYLQLKKEFEGN